MLAAHLALPGACQHGSAISAMPGTRLAWEETCSKMSPR